MGQHQPDSQHELPPRVTRGIKNLADVRRVYWLLRLIIFLCAIYVFLAAIDLFVLAAETVGKRFGVQQN